MEGMDWIHLAQDRDQWQALVNTVMNKALTKRPPLVGEVSANFCG
jgi:hypothetical protein